MKSPTSPLVTRTLCVLAGLGCAFPAAVGAQGLNLDGAGDEEDNDLPAMEMLVEGSILQKILLPQYDEQHHLSSVLRADKLVLVDDETIDAEAVRIEFYHPDRSLKAGIDLKTARLHDQRLLRSSDPVTLASDDFTATGTGIVYEIDRSRGFLHGPATARTLIDTRTSMNMPRPRHFGAAGLALVAAGALNAQEPETLSDQEMQGLDRLAGSQEHLADEATEAADVQIETTETLAGEADASLKDFLAKAAVEMKEGPTPDLTSKVPDPEVEKEFKLPASIQAKKGIFFDSESGVLVFLESVDIDHPEFTLTGADEVKVFMEQDESSPDDEDEKENGVLADAKFGDPARIVATGTVVVERKKLQPGDKAAKASGRQMVMDLNSNELIIRGGQPWIISDTANGRVVDPKGYIMINLESGDASFVGDAKGFIEIDKGH